MASITNNLLVPLGEVCSYWLCTKTVRKDKRGWLTMWEIQFIQERFKTLNISKMDRYKDNRITLLRWLRGHKRNQCIYVLQRQESYIYSCNWVLGKERFEPMFYIKKDFFFLQRIIRNSPVNHTMKGEKNYFKGKLASSPEWNYAVSELMVQHVGMPLK